MACGQYLHAGGINENVHSQGRGCSECGRPTALPGSPGEYTFKRLKLNHMVPSGFPIVYWHGEKQNDLGRGLMKKGRDSNEHPLRLFLSLKPKEVRYASVKRGVQREREPGRNTKKDL